MIFQEFSASIKSVLQQYSSAGLIDDMAIYEYMLDGMSELSLLPTIRIETVLEVRNNKAKLPEGFKSLYMAIKCDPHKAVIDSEEPQDFLQDIYYYKVREVKENTWNICEPCDIDEKDSCVVEKVYFHNGTRGNLYYNNLIPVKLNLTRHTRRTQCDPNCRNLSVNDSPYEISINKNHIYTNFKSGQIFLVYNGLEEDEDGFIMIPETAENNIYKFLKAYVIREFLKRMFANSDNTTNEQFLYQMYDRDAEKYQMKAGGELRMARVLPQMSNYSRKIRREFEIYNFSGGMNLK